MKGPLCYLNVGRKTIDLTRVLAYAETLNFALVQREVFLDEARDD